MLDGGATVSLETMARNLDVDVAGLLQGSSDTGHRAELLATAHGQSVSSVSHAQAGWVGSSAQSLASMAEKWQQISARHTKAIENHAVQMDIVAKLFADREERHAQQLKAVGEQARGHGLS
ncbi:hypothetical protein BH10ACT9_BH10ACT9_38810 [soil metagenome]